MLYTVESLPPHSVLTKERRKVKGFKSAHDRDSFLCTSDNALRWRVPVEGSQSYGLKPGTYAYAGGKWHNVKSLDAMTLAHI